MIELHFVRDNIVKNSKRGDCYCGPYVIGLLTGFSHVELASYISGGINAKVRIQRMYNFQIESILGLCGYSVSRTYLKAVYKGITVKDLFSTVYQDSTYLISVDNHVLLFHEGRIYDTFSKHGADEYDMKYHRHADDKVVKIDRIYKR